MEVILIMTLKDYIDEEFPINDLVRQYNSDPITRIMQADSLPFDKIVYIDGKLQKAVEISEDEYISVFDLISMEEAEAKTMPAEFQEVYYAYMDNIEIKDVDVFNIMKLSREYRKNKQAKQERLK